MTEENVNKADEVVSEEELNQAEELVSGADKSLYKAKNNRAREKDQNFTPHPKP